MLPKNGENSVWKNLAGDFAVTVSAKNFIQSALSCTVSDKNVFLSIMQKFMMAAKNGGKSISGKKCQMTL